MSPFCKHCSFFCRFSLVGRLLWLQTPCCALIFELLSFSENAVTSTILNEEAPIYELDRNRCSDVYPCLPAVAKNNMPISFELILILSLFPESQTRDACYPEMPKQSCWSAPGFFFIVFICDFNFYYKCLCFLCFSIAL